MGLTAALLNNREFCDRFCTRLGEALSRGVDTELLLPCAVGGAVAALTGFFAIRLVGRLAEKGSLRCFSWYCWAIGLSAIITSIVT